MKTLEEAVRALYHWQYDPEDSFNAILVLTYRKADLHNKKLLGSVYPHLAVAMDLWEEAGDYGKDLFRQWGLME